MFLSSVFKNAVCFVSLVGLTVTAMAKSQGPGLGNLNYSAGDMSGEISRISENTPNGPPARPSNAPKLHWGMNTGAMINGYFMVPFAYDSGNAGGGLLTYDLSNPRKPKLVKRLYDKRTDDFREIHSMGYSNIGKTKYLIMQSHKGIHIWNVTDVRKPVRTGKVDFLPGGDYGNTPWQLFYQHPYVYVTGANTGLWIIDVKNPKKPKVADLKNRVNPIPLSELGGFRVGPIWTMGNRMVLTSMDNKGGISQLDISDPLNPELLSTIPTVASHYYSSSFNGKHLLLTNRKDDLATFYDLTNPMKITLSHQFPTIKQDQLYGAYQDENFFIGAHYKTIKVDMRKKVKDEKRVLKHFQYPRGVDSADEVTVLGNVIVLGSDHGPSSYFVPHQEAQDKKAPAVRITSPVNKSLKQDVRTRIGVSFTDNINLDTVNSSNFSVRPVIGGKTGKPIKGVFSAYWNMVNFTPSKVLKTNTTYLVQIKGGGLKDWAGNRFAKSYSFSFKTTDKDFSQLSGNNVRVSVAENLPSKMAAKATIKLKVENANNTKYIWSLGDGSKVKVTNSPELKHLYKRPGRYQVLVTAEGDSGRDLLSFIHVVHYPLSKNQATKSSQLIYHEGVVYTVNSDNDTITAVKHDSRSGLKKLWEEKAGKHPSSLALSPRGEIWVANKEDSTITVHHQSSGQLIRTIKFTRGSRPAGIIFSANKKNAYVSLEARGQVLKLSLTGKTLGKVSLGVNSRPRGLAMTSDSRRLFVTRFISKDSHGEVYEISPSKMKLLKPYKLALDKKSRDDSFSARGVANYLNSVAIAPDGYRAWIPSKKDNILRGFHKDGQKPTFETSIRPIISQIFLKDKRAKMAKQIVDLNDRSMPSNIAFTPAGDIAFCTTEGSNTVEMIDTFSYTPLGNLHLTGLTPRGIAVNDEGTYLYVQNFMTRDLECFDITGIRNGTSYSSEQVGRVSLVAKEKLSSTVLKGKQVFYNSGDGRMSRDKYISCATCHDDGGHDGRTWDFTDRGEGMRNTPTLRGRSGMGHGFVHWSANFDEIQDFENDIRGPFGGTGFIPKNKFKPEVMNTLGTKKAGLSPELDAMAAYVASLSKIPESPYTPTAKLSAKAKKGYKVFLAEKCYACHSGSSLTNSRVGQFYLSDVGTLSKASGKRLNGVLPGVDTPSLKGLWLTAPYLHDGSAASLKDIFQSKNKAKLHGSLTGLNRTEISYLSTLLMQLDDQTANYFTKPAIKKFLGKAKFSKLSSKPKAVAYNAGEEAYVFKLNPEISLYYDLVLEERRSGSWKKVDQPLFTRQLKNKVLRYTLKSDNTSRKFRYKLSRYK